MTLSAAVAGNFTVGETITGSTSGATAVVVTAATSTITYGPLGDSNKVFAAETITGGTSGVTATVATISKGDIENGYITIPDLVTNVVRVFPLNGSTGTVNMFDIKYQMHMNDIHSLGYMGSLLEYTLTQQWISMIDMVIDSSKKHNRSVYDYRVLSNIRSCNLYRYIQ